VPQGRYLWQKPFMSAAEWRRPSDGRLAALATVSFLVPKKNKAEDIVVYIYYFRIRKI